MVVQGKLVAVDEKEDPREALLKHANKKDEFSDYMQAYNQTQPKTVVAAAALAYHQEEEEEGEGEERG